MKAVLTLLLFFLCSLGNAKEGIAVSEEQQDTTTLTTDFERASALNGQGQYEESRQILKGILKKLPAAKKKSKTPEAYDEIDLNTTYELAYNYLSTNQLEEAIVFCNQVIQKSTLTKNIPLAIESYNLSGLIHKRLFMLDKAIEQYSKALELNTLSDNHQLGKIIMNNIASLYTELDRNQEALAMGRKMMTYFPTEKEETEQSHIEHLITLNTVGVLLGNAALAQNSVDTFRIAINEIKQNTPAGLKLLLYTNYANSLDKTGMADSALYYYESALPLIQETTNPYNIANLHYLYGCLLKDTYKKPQQASLHLTKAADFYRKNPSGVLPKCLEQLADLKATAFQDNAGAYGLLAESYQSYKENTQKQYKDKLSGFEAEFKTREKEMEIKELHLQREAEQTEYRIQIISILATLFIVILIAIILSFFLRKKKAELKLKELVWQRSIDQKSHEIEALSTEMTQKMTEKYINGLEDSNKRIAGELHDGICNKLLALHMGLHNTPSEQLAEELGAAYSELRLLSHELASPEFKTITLNQLLDTYIGKLQQAKLFDLTYFIDEKVKRITFSQAVAREVYRIIQEALTNIIKHATAKSVHITISDNQGTMEIMIEDDGQGYNAQTATTGLGIRMMKERVASLNATLSIETKLNKGTVVYVSIPYC